MKANFEIISEMQEIDSHFNSIFKALLNHFQYSIEDINSYDELTENEKKIISRDMWDRLTIKSHATIY